MINLIGKRRILILLSLVILNGGLAGIVFGYILPLYNDAQNEKRRIESEIRSTRGKIQNIKQEMEQLEANQKRYVYLRDEQGYFQNQDRFELRRIMDETSSFSRLINASWSVQPLEIVPNDNAKRIEKAVLRSVLSVDLEAFLDTDIYDFVDRINYSFPGQSRLLSLDLSRGSELENEALEQIASGEPVAFVNGAMRFEWYTMIDTEDLPEGMRPGGNGRRR